MLGEVVLGPDEQRGEEDDGGVADVVARLADCGRGPRAKRLRHQLICSGQSCARASAVSQARGGEGEGMPRTIAANLLREPPAVPIVPQPLFCFSDHDNLPQIAFFPVATDC